MSDDVVNTGRRRFLTGATTVVGTAGAAGVAVPFIGSWSPSAKAKAAGAPVKINISRLELGAQMVVEWRGQPVFILHRTAETMSVLEKEQDMLADPASANEAQQPGYAQNTLRARGVRPEILVLKGLCTHLGCSPKLVTQEEANETVGLDWKGGYFCPCHGSKFDLAGRVYSGVPAPSNLPVPPYSYESKDVIVIGVDEENA